MSKQLKKSGSGVSGGEIVSPPFHPGVTSRNLAAKKKENKWRKNNDQN